jgi:hypothetical protein
LKDHKPFAVINHVFTLTLNIVPQVVWIEWIKNENSRLSPADQVTVLGSVGGGGFRGNEAILQDADFIISMAAAIEATYGGSEADKVPTRMDSNNLVLIGGRSS